MNRIIDIDKWQEIYYVLAKNKFRTFLTAFGVSWGIFMLLVMLGAGSGLENGVLQNFGNRATNAVFMWTQRTTIPYKGFPVSRRFSFDNEDTKAIKNNIDELEFLAPRAQLGGYRGSDNVVYKLNTGAYSVRGDVPAIFKIDPITMLDGRFLNDKDIEHKRKIAIIGKRVKEELFDAGEDPIGKYIRIQGVYFQVVGVFNQRGRGGNNEGSQSIFIPFSTFQRAFNWGNTVGWYSMTAKKQYPASLLEEKVIKLLAERHSIHPDDHHAFGSWNMEEEFSKFQNLFGGINALIWIVGLGTLFAGVIGVSNIMLVVVKERTKEIGIKRAIGATPYNIITQTIIESLIITGFAGVAGLIFGVAVVEGLSYFLQGIETSNFANPEINLEIAIKAIIVLMISGVFAGMIPARRAVQIKPIDALRTE